MNKRLIKIFTWMLLLVSIPVMGAKTDLLMLLPGFPGTTEQAQPYVETMLRYIEKDLKLESGTMHGTFISDGTKAEAKLSEVKPGIALLGPSVYAKNSSDKTMKIVAKLFILGQEEQKYYLVTKNDGADSISDFADKTVSGVIVHDEKFVKNVIFDKGAPDSIIYKFNKRPLKALRDVASGTIDGALIDSATKEHMDTLDFAKDLKIIYTSKPVPPPVIVVLNDSVKDAAKIKKSLTSICKTPEGKKLCNSLTISNIAPASDRDYSELVKKYNR
ncbi:MAG: PhnD/SsuA/transferrin family substrate-binding protein [Deltaproteobacteria bacterium]|nr:PhnD/SsuA/transferrin family substrate-binding protein [Deltaproteobacteria bacterium]